MRTPEKNRVERQPQEPVPTKVTLEFFRHGTKQPGQEPTIRITPESRAEAESKGHDLNPQTKVAMGWSSPRDRTRETTAHVMLANEEITPTMELEEINDLISQNIPVGNKIKTSPLLDFRIDPDTPYGQAAREAFKKGEFLSFLTHESDAKAFMTKDKSQSTSTRLASQIAQIIKRYIKISETFNRLANKDQAKYQDTGYQLERYLGTHQGVAESFMVRAIALVYGVNEQSALIEKLNKSGFQELQGFRIEIINQPNQEKLIRLTVKIEDEEKTYDLPPEIIDKIINDNESFKKDIK